MHTPTNVYSNSYIFCCPGYTHINNEKLEPRSIKSLFLYMCPVSRAWGLEVKKVITCKDIIFIEIGILHNLPSRDASDETQYKSSM